MKVFAFVVFVSSMVISAPQDARAQIYESVGIRAQGMGGAFVALADDASATWWNPAGLAGGAFFNAIIEYETAQEPRVAADAAGAATPSWRSGGRGVAVAFPALGLSYYRLRVSEIRAFGPTAAPSLGRQDQGRAPVVLRSLVLQQFGATVGQSVGEHLVIGSTLKLMNGAFASTTAVAAGTTLDRASDLEGEGRMRGDLDLGALVTFGPVQAGVVVKNVTEPAFASGADHVDLRRQARVGLAVSAEGVKSTGRITFALDADLTRTGTAAGDVRHIAAGVEAWTRERRLAIRGGISANTVDEARLAAAGGVSVALRSGVYLDGEGTVGADRSRKGWGIALRMTF